MVASRGTEDILNVGTESAILIPQTLASTSCHLCPRAQGAALDGGREVETSQRPG